MKAVVLAAGQGTRLRPLTENLPKCMVPFMGKPLIERSIEALADAGVDETIFVVGYCKDEISNYFGDQFKNMRMTYVEAKDFATTNNIVSFWVAKDAIRDSGFLLLEGDLLYDPELIPSICNNPNKNVAVVDNWTPQMDGSVVFANGDQVNNLVLKRDQDASFDYKAALKTVNIYKFSADAVSLIFDHVGEWISQGKTDQYYEAVFSSLIDQNKLDLFIHAISPHRWAETDTVEDLKLAESIFSELQP